MNCSLLAYKLRPINLIYFTYINIKLQIVTFPIQKEKHLKELERLQKLSAELTTQGNQLRTQISEQGDQLVHLKMLLEEITQREQHANKQLREKDDAMKQQTKEVERVTADNSFLQRTLTEKDEKVTIFTLMKSR